jgi:hypothetical protein
MLIPWKVSPFLLKLTNLATKSIGNLVHGHHDRTGDPKCA